MEVRVEQVNVNDEQSVIYVYGEIDAYTAPELRDTLVPLCEKSGQQIEVDLSNVDYMDSTGLGVFVGAHKAAEASGAKLILKNLTARVARLFNITGLDDIIKVAAPLEQGGEKR